MPASRSPVMRDGIIRAMMNRECEDTITSTGRIFGFPDPTGIRTSGSYLAPLYAAFLQAHAYRDVAVLTLRPGRGWLAPERAILRDAVRSGGFSPKARPKPPRRL